MVSSIGRGSRIRRARTHSLVCCSRREADLEVGTLGNTTLGLHSRLSRVSTDRRVSRVRRSAHSGTPP
jgi:hypothetical protein